MGQRYLLKTWQVTLRGESFRKRGIVTGFELSGFVNAHDANSAKSRAIEIVQRKLDGLVNAESDKRRDSCGSLAQITNAEEAQEAPSLLLVECPLLQLRYDNPTSPPAVVINCAVASDGGSRWLQLSVDGQAKGYGLHRSIASRGTSRYEEISGEDGLLTKDELHDLLSMLDAILEHGMCAGIVHEFVKVLKKSALT